MMSKEELLANLNTPLYEHGDVIRATDATFLMWVNRCLVVPSDDSTGSGKRRLYSPADVVKIGVMKALSSRPRTTSHLRRDGVVPFWQNTFLPNGELAEFGL